MKRRDFLKKSAAGVVGAGLLAGCAPSASGPSVQTRKNIRWRLASSYPHSLDTIFGAAETVARRVKELTDGRFEILVYPAGEMVPALQVMDAVQQETVQMAHTASYYFTGKHPALAFDTTMPFGLTARQQLAWLNQAGGLQLMREIMAPFNIVNYPGGNTGVQMGGWFRHEIKSVDDLKGLKMRIPGAGGKVMSALGATVQVLAGGDIFPALERGAIDATEWVGPYDDEKLGFHKIAKNYYYPGWWEPGPVLSFYVNATALAGLPSDYKAALECAMAEATLEMMNKYDVLNPSAVERLLAAGVTMRPFSPDVMEAAARVNKDLIQQEVSANADFAKIHAHWNAFRIASNKWFSTAELAFTEYAFRRDS